MLRKIRDLDFERIVADIAGATDPVRRIACHGTVHAGLAFIESRPDAVEWLRNRLVVALIRDKNTIEAIRFDQPLVQALVRAQHHPLAVEIPPVRLERGIRGPDVAPHLTQIVAAHADVCWDVDAVQALIIKAIREEHGNHELDDDVPPWDMYWSPASSAALALIVLVTLRTLGDL